MTNGVALEKFVQATGQGRHGPHPQYTAQITEVFTKLEAILGVGVPLAPEQAQKLMENLVNGNSKYQGIRNIINNTSGNLNALNLNLNNIDVLDLLGD